MSIPPAPQRENDPQTDNVINEIASGISSPDPDPDPLPQLPQEKSQSSVFLNILVSIFIVVLGGVASYYLIASMHKTTYAPKTSMITPPVEETIVLTEQYNNPFSPNVQYANPFSTPSANPFNSLTGK